MTRKQSGFTLIEVMVAIALMAIVSIIAWRGLENISSIRERLRSDADDIDGIVRMLGQLDTDVTMRAPDNMLDQIQVSGPPDTGTGTTPDTSTATNTTTPPPAATPPGGTTGTTVSVASTQVLPQSIRVITTDSANTPFRLEIIRADAANPGAWQRVAWFVQDATLRRAAGLSSRQYPIPPTGAGAPIMASVQRFVVRGWMPGQGWIDMPFPTTGIAITGLELSVERGTANGVERYRRVVVFN